MTMKLNDKADLKRLRKQIDAALTEVVGEHHGLIFKAGTINFEPDGSGCEVKIDIRIKGALEKWERDAQRSFMGYAKGGSFDGIGPDDLGAPLLRNGEKWTLIGYKARARRDPFLVRRESDGKAYRFPEAIVAAGLASAKKNATS